MEWSEQKLQVFETPSRIATIQSLCRKAAIASVLFGCVVFIGWMFDIPILKALLSGLVSMKINACAVCMIGGMFVLLLHKQKVSLELWINECTIKLEVASSRLQEEIAERIQAQSALQRYKDIFEFTEHGLAIGAADGSVLEFINPTFARMHGFTVEELLGTPILDLYPPEYAAFIPEFVDIANQTGHFSFETVHYRKDGSTFPVLVELTAVKDADGKVLYRIATNSDITKRKLAEEEQCKSEQRYRFLADVMPQIVWTARPDGYLDYYNQRWYEFTGFVAGEGGDNSWKPILHPDDVELCLNRWYESVRTGEPYEFEYRFFDSKTNSYRWHLGRALPMRGAAGEIVMWAGTCTDIHDYKEAQKTLLKTHERLELKFQERTATLQAEIAERMKVEAELRALFTAMTDVVIVRDAQGRCLKIPPTNSMNLYKQSAAEMIGRTLHETFPRSVADTILSYIQQALKTQKTIHGEYSLIIEEREVYFSANFSPISQDAVILVARDITERKRAELHIQTLNAELEQRVIGRTAALRRANEKLATEVSERKQAEEALQQSEELIRIAVESTGLGTWDYYPLSGRLQWSARCKAVFGLPPEAEVSYDMFLSRLYPEDRERTDEIVQRCLDPNGNGEYNIEYRTLWPDGTVRWAAAMGRVYFNEQQPYRFIGTILDITERKLAEEQLKATLSEKIVLLKEIHHRVKNNLQIISSLLSLQSNYVDEPRTLEILQSGQNRVASMALIHEQLYQSEDFASINVSEYIKNLATNLFSSFDNYGSMISFQIEIPEIYLNIELAIPCGLIINELISNSLKYAFPQGKSGKIRISLISSDGNIILTFSDDGVGIPKKLDWQNTDTLGLKLVNALTNQIKGVLELHTNMGTEFKLTFPNKILQ